MADVDSSGFPMRLHCFCIVYSALFYAFFFLGPTFGLHCFVSRYRQSRLHCEVYLCDKVMGTVEIIAMAAPLWLIEVGHAAGSPLKGSVNTCSPLAHVNRKLSMTLCPLKSTGIHDGH